MKNLRNLSTGAGHFIFTMGYLTFNSLVLNEKLYQISHVAVHLKAV